MPRTNVQGLVGFCTFAEKIYFADGFPSKFFDFRTCFGNSCTSGFYNQAQRYINSLRPETQEKSPVCSSHVLLDSFVFSLAQNLHFSWCIPINICHQTFRSKLCHPSHRLRSRANQPLNRHATPQSGVLRTFSHMGVKDNKMAPSKTSKCPETNTRGSPGKGGECERAE